MSNKTSISNSESYLEIGKFWDEHDATEFGEQKDAEFNVNIKSHRRYYFTPGNAKKVSNRKTNGRFVDLLAYQRCALFIARLFVRRNALI